MNALVRCGLAGHPTRMTGCDFVADVCVYDPNSCFRPFSDMTTRWILVFPYDLYPTKSGLS